VWGQGPVSFFVTWISGCPNTICWKDYFSPLNGLSGTPVENQWAIDVWAHFLTLWTGRFNAIKIAILPKWSKLQGNPYHNSNEHFLQKWQSSKSGAIIYEALSSKKNFIFYYCSGWGYTVAFTKVLKIYHTWIHRLHSSPLFPPPPIHGIVSTGIIFPFTYMCTKPKKNTERKKEQYMYTQYLHYIRPPMLYEKNVEKNSPITHTS
jgi:hypothetical protein